MAQMRLTVFTDIVNPDFERAVEEIVAEGFTAVDLRSNIYGKAISELTPLDAQRAVKIIQKSGLQVACLGASLFSQCGPDRETRQEMTDDELAVLMNLFDLGDLFSCQNIRIFTYPRVDEDWETQARRQAPRFRQAAVLAEEHWKRLLIENEVGTLTQTCAEAGRFLRLVDHPSLRMNWDIVNGWRAGETPDEEAYRHIARLVSHIHIKGARESKQTPGHFATFALPGEDDLRHTDILGLLIRDNYEGFITVDPHYHGFAPEDMIQGVENPPAVAVWRTAEFLRTTVGAA